MTWFQKLCSKTPFQQIVDAWDWFRFSTYDRYDIIKIKGLRRGYYYDKDSQLLFAVFSLLVDYVERELAHLYKITSKSREEYKGKSKAEMGLAYLDWEITSEQTSPGQKEEARKIKELYLWWIDRMTLGTWVTPEQDDEDTEKLIELCKVRGHLWT